jgi:rod shape-determining protein MreC
MPLGTLDRTPPPFFKQGPSALSKLVVFSALALFLMVADVRFGFIAPVRSVVATALYPLQWLLLRPVMAVTGLHDYVQAMQVIRTEESQTQQRLVSQAARAQQVEQLELENRRLRELLSMRERISTPAKGAQVLFDAADPFSRKVVIDRGQTHGVLPGSPVIDEFGVLGQVTRVYPLVSEVTLVVDRDQSIPVLNARTGVRSVAYGQTTGAGDGMELRFTLANADVQAGDLLTTSGVDGVYPPGLAVARVSLVERRAESSFTRIGCEPLARVNAARHVLVLDPVGAQLPSSPLPARGTVLSPEARRTQANPRAAP